MRYLVPQDVLEQTFAVFRQCGGGRRECQALWTSNWQSPDLITEVVHPAHRSHLGGFVVDGCWLNALWLDLVKDGKGVRVQIHTHPGEAFHSSTDDQFPLIHSPGFLSLVIPNCGLGAVGFLDAFLCEIQADGCWREVEIGTRLRIVH